ncbi:Uncharacterised protein [uncultured archaeon]|nr:Uncharacterised protein [uncultured archaeon]
MMTLPSDCSIMSFNTFVMISLVAGFSLSFENSGGTDTAIVSLFSLGNVRPKDISRVSRVIPRVAFTVSNGASVADIRTAEWTASNKGAVTFFGMHTNNSSLPYISLFCLLTPRIG